MMMMIVKFPWYSYLFNLFHVNVKVDYFSEMLHLFEEKILNISNKAFAITVKRRFSRPRYHTIQVIIKLFGPWLVRSRSYVSLSAAEDIFK